MQCSLRRREIISPVHRLEPETPERTTLSLATSLPLRRTADQTTLSLDTILVFQTNQVYPMFSLETRLAILTRRGVQTPTLDCGPGGRTARQEETPFLVIRRVLITPPVTTPFLGIFRGMIT